MKRQRKKYSKPTTPFDKQRFEREKEVAKEFGLRRKHELWRTEGLLRKYRRLARELAASQDKEREKVLVGKLIRMGVLSQDATLDDVLGLTVQKFLERRLAILVFKKGFANSVRQARQFVTHGHVLVNEKRINYPSYLVTKDEEGKIKVAIVPKQKKPAEVPKAITEAPVQGEVSG